MTGVGLQAPARSTQRLRCRSAGELAASIAVVALTVLVSAIPVAAPAGADPVPFTDQNASGYIGFCDKNHRQIRSGKVGDAPFVWTAVSSAPAPPGYVAGVGRGVLYVYQPRKEVDPGDWSGKQMTAASRFTNATYPMAQATGLDPALVDFVSVFPPKWDGLVQLRMYFTAPDRPVHSIPYPATVVRVSGDTWTVVSGGDVPCNAGRAVSVETVNLPSSILHGPTARSTPGIPVSGATGGSASADPTSQASTGGMPRRSGKASAPPGNPRGSTASSRSGTPVAVDRKSSKGSGRTIAVVVLAIACAAGAATAVVRRRRSGRSRDSSGP